MLNPQPLPPKEKAVTFLLSHPLLKNLANAGGSVCRT